MRTMRYLILLSIFLSVFSLSINKNIRFPGTELGFRRTKEVKIKPGDLTSAIKEALRAQDTSERDKSILNLADNILRTSSISIVRFDVMRTLLGLSEATLNEHGIREAIIEEALQYGEPHKSSHEDHAVVSILAELPSLSNSSEIARVYDKLLFYIYNTPDGNLKVAAVQAMITRFSKDKLSVNERRKYMTAAFQSNWTAMNIAEMSTHQFSFLLGQGFKVISVEQMNDVARELKRWMDVRNLSSRNLIDLRAYNVDEFKNLFLNSLLLGEISPKEAKRYITDLMAKSAVFRSRLSINSYNVVNSEEQNTKVLVALALFEQELIKLAENTPGSDRLVEEDMFELLREDLSANIRSIAHSALSPYIELKEPAIVGLIRLNQTCPASNNWVQELKLLSVIGLPRVPGLEKEQDMLSQERDAGRFVSLEKRSMQGIEFVNSNFYYNILSALSDLARAGFNADELRSWFSYFATDFYDEFYANQEVQKYEQIVQGGGMGPWSPFITHDLPFIISRSLEGLSLLP